MFCPKCKCNYGENLAKCPDCNVDLVNESPEKAKTEKQTVYYTDLEFIFATNKYTDIVLIKSIFEGGDITYFIQGEDMGVTQTGIAARVLVKKEQVEEAIELLREFGLMS